MNEVDIPTFKHFPPTEYFNDFLLIIIPDLNSSIKCTINDCMFFIRMCLEINEENGGKQQLNKYHHDLNKEV